MPLKAGVYMKIGLILRLT